MIGPNGERAAPGLRGLIVRPTTHAAIVLIVLWIGTAVLLRETNEFGPMIAILVCASVVLWGTGRQRGRDLVLHLVLWAALLAGTATILWESPRLVGMLVLFGAAAVWLLVADAMFGRRSRA